LEAAGEFEISSGLQRKLASNIEDDTSTGTVN